MILMIPLACRLGMKDEVLSAAIALTAHEGAHLLAAAAMGIAVPELRLMPFGGSARIGNPYALSPVRLALTAAAGPFANLLLIMFSAALAHWNALTAESAFTLLKVNLVLMLFNLLPALPLDGGRMLYAVLSGFIGRERALQTGIILGRILSAALAAAAVVLLVQRRVFNLSYVFAALFILSSAPHERAALSSAGVHTMLSALSPVSGPVPVNMIAVDGACPARRALKSARPARANLYAVYSQGRLSGLTDDRALLEMCLEHSPDTPVIQAAKSFPTVQKRSGQG